MPEPREPEHRRRKHSVRADASEASADVIPDTVATYLRLRGLRRPRVVSPARAPSETTRTHPSHRAAIRGGSATWSPT